MLSVCLNLGPESLLKCCELNQSPRPPSLSFLVNCGPTLLLPCLHLRFAPAAAYSSRLQHLMSIVGRLWSPSSLGPAQLTTVLQHPQVLCSSQPGVLFMLSMARGKTRKGQALC